MLMLLAAMHAHAQPNETDVLIDDARKQIEEIRKNLSDQTDDAKLLEQRLMVLKIQSKAEAAVETLVPELASVVARLTEIGQPAAEGKEAPDIAARRVQLEKSRNALDRQMKLARLLAIEATQTAEQITALRRSQFQARLGERRVSILGTQFWSELGSDLSRDIPRIYELGGELAINIGGATVLGWTLALLSTAFIGMLWIWIARCIFKFYATRLPPGRLRRALHALAFTLLAAIMPGLIAEFLSLGLTHNDRLSANAAELVKGLVGMVTFGGYVAGLGCALLSANRPTWRLPPLPDSVAHGMRLFPIVLGVLIVAVWLADRLPVLLNASVTTTIAINCFMTLTLSAYLGIATWRWEQLQRQSPPESEQGIPPPRPLWASGMAALMWIGVGVSVISVLVGYVAFGSFVIRQTIWLLVVLASAYLLSLLAEYAFCHLMPPGWANDGNGRARLRAQMAILLTGLARLFVVLLAAVFMWIPFGEGSAEIFHRLHRLHSGVAIGEVRINPTSVLQAVVVLTLTLVAVKILKRWLLKRYLPTTEMDPGMQVSAATLFGYAGTVLAVALALSAVGIGLERVAWIASALSVGIGFGLQAVVQNFVSGLILLAEQPVKVGDWVSLGGIEGDIRRINVRATEIQMTDRSTVIVPNSEFITKTVRNVTHASPLGLVQIKLPLPLDVDAPHVRQLLLQVFQSHAKIMETPAPEVFLDGIENGNLIFKATGFVTSPRAAYGVRSALLFDVLKRQAGIDTRPLPTVLIEAGAKPQ